ncbi:MAG: hypothetical protein WD226_13745, partial [Planctomycetota bacterium]
RGSMSPDAEATTGEALERAQAAMERAAGELEAGNPAGAAEAQRQAQEALRDAQREARDGVQPQSPEDRASAEELAREQERIREEILDLARRMREEEERDPENLERAAEEAERAEAALESGDLSAAEKREQRVEQELQQLEDVLAEEEDQYQKLRAEELLFRIAEEVTSLLETHMAQSSALTELDAERAPRGAPSRAQRLQLRRIEREEVAIATRTAELADAIEGEGSMVSAELLRAAESDLVRIAEALSEKGDYETGERTQALQRDVTESFEWLLEALREELERRQNEDQEPQESQSGDEGQNEESLVPDTTELKLLRKMEIEVQEDVRQIRLLFPNLGQGDAFDDMAMTDITRLAVKHQKIAELFQAMRERVGVPAPGAKGEAPESPTEAPDGPENDR